MEEFSNLVNSLEFIEETKEYQILVHTRGTSRKVQKLKKRSFNFREMIHEAQNEGMEFIFAEDVKVRSPLKNKSPVDMLEKNSPKLAIIRKSPLPEKLFVNKCK